MGMFLFLFFQIVHEGDEGFFTLIDKNQKIHWDEWSEYVIILNREHSIEHEEPGHYTEDTNRTLRN